MQKSIIAELKKIESRLQLCKPSKNAKCCDLIKEQLENKICRYMYFFNTKIQKIFVNIYKSMLLVSKYYSNIIRFIKRILKIVLAVKQSVQ